LYRLKCSQQLNVKQSSDRFRFIRVLNVHKSSWQRRSSG